MDEPKRDTEKPTPHGDPLLPPGGGPEPVASPDPRPGDSPKRQGDPLVPKPAADGT